LAKANIQVLTEDIETLTESENEQNEVGNEDSLRRDEILTNKELKTSNTTIFKEKYYEDASELIEYVEEIYVQLLPVELQFDAISPRREEFTETNVSERDDS
jgi:hypothetical protein